MSTATPTRATVDDLLAIEGKAELIGGRIVHLMGTGYRPNRVAGRCFRSLDDWAETTGRGVALADSVRQLAGLAAFAHVKDARGTPEKFEFLLPGEHGTDYRELARLLPAAGYAGPVVVEVSGQISTRPGYDPAVAARTSYANLAAAFGRPVRK